MELATITSLDEQSKFLDLFNKSNITFTQTWIGGTDEGSEGNWYWPQTGHKVDFQINWNEGEPNNYGNKPENCLALMDITGIYKFNDFNCGTKASFVCEYINH